MNLRPILPADLESCADVFYAADDELMSRTGLPQSPRNPVALLRLFEHISSTNPERAWLAEHSGRVTAFGMAVRRDDLVFLSFLFVHPRVQGRGLGRTLLEQCIAGGTNRAVCIFSMQPVSAALYALYGMVPRVPLYAVVGRPRRELPGLSGQLRLGAIQPAQLAALDRDATGFARHVDHAVWAAWERTLFGVFEADSAVGYAYAHESGRIGPVVVSRPELMLPVVGQLMREIEPADDWMVNVPGPAGAAFAGLLAAGMRLDGPPVIFCSSRTAIDHGRYLPATAALP
jgi:GNAT superfamily N-acetyltransferase